jgi:hypothetical protein
VVEPTGRDSTVAGLTVRPKIFFSERAVVLLPILMGRASGRDTPSTLLDKEMKMDLAGELSEYAVSLRYSDLSKHAVHTAKQRLIDSLGGGLGNFAAVPAPDARSSGRPYPPS